MKKEELLKNIKSQSAIEYLTTYGVAILIILVALSALFYLGVFSSKTPNQCIIPAPFVCRDLVFKENSVSLYLSAIDIETATIKSMLINGYNCIDYYQGKILVNEIETTDISSISLNPMKIECITTVNNLAVNAKSTVNINIDYMMKDKLLHNIDGGGSGTIESGTTFYDNIFTGAVIEDVYYVAIYGNDSWPGNLTQPFATITKARDRIRELKQNNDFVKPIIVYLRDGTYYINETFVLDSRDSGMYNQTITYQAYPEENVIISGGKEITEWNSYLPSIYKSNLNNLNINYNFNTLFENEERGAKARSPNSGYFYVESVVANNNKREFIYYQGDISNFDFTNAQAYIWSGSDKNWIPDVIQISNIDWSTRKITLARDTTYEISKGNRYFIQNSLDLLNAPGEFYLDESNKFLYYWAHNSPIQDQRITVPVMSKIVELKGNSSDYPVQHIKFQGLTFAVSDSFKETLWSNPPISDASIYLENVTNISIRLSTIKQAGVLGIKLFRYAQDNEIYGNLIDDVGVHCIWSGGSGIGAGYVNRNNNISNNLIKNCGKLHGAGSGIVLDLHGSGDNEISYNKIINTTRYGISLKGMTYSNMQSSYYGNPVTWDNHWDFLYTRNNKIRFNEISNVLLDSQDAGAIESWGSGKNNLIYNNLITNFTSTITNGLSMGIYLDDASDYFTVKNNIVFGGSGTNDYPIFAKGVYNDIINNMIINEGKNSHIQFYSTNNERNDNINITRNIFYRNNNASDIFFFVDWTDNKITDSNNNVYYPEGDYVFLSWNCSDISNLVLNPSFEQNLSNWTRHPSSSVMLSALNEFDATFGRANVTEPSNQSCYPVSYPSRCNSFIQTIGQVEANKSFKATAVFRALDGTTGRLELLAKNINPSLRIDIVKNVNGTGQWEFITTNLFQTLNTTDFFNILEIRLISQSPDQIGTYTDWTDVRVCEIKRMNLSEWRNSFGFDSDSIVQDPLFIDYNNGNFNLQPNSPAFNLGFEQINTNNIGPSMECFEDSECILGECIQKECV